MPAPRKEYPEAVSLYSAGMSLSDVAGFYGVTRQSMFVWFKRRGIKLRPQAQVGPSNTFYRGGVTQDERARVIYRTAIKRGVLVNPKVCSECGSTTHVSGHHDDYSKPLSVRWLCHKCHFQWHEANKALPAHDLPPTMTRAEICSLGGKAAQSKKRNELPKGVLQRN